MPSTKQIPKDNCDQNLDLTRGTLDLEYNFADNANPCKGFTICQLRVKSKYYLQLFYICV